MTATTSTWRTSSYSNSANNNCVEVRLTPEHAAVRDTKARTTGALHCSRQQWASFVHAVQRG